MYNDDDNLYHYSYPQDGSYSSGSYQTPIISEPPKPPKKKRTGLKVAVLLLLVALIGAGVGVGVTSIVLNRNTDVSDSSASVSSEASSESASTSSGSHNTVSNVALKTVDGVTPLTDAEVYATNVNSVVSINVTGTTQSYGMSYESVSSGSGFILTQDGYIATNYHVIEGAETVEVALYSGETYDATIIGGDEDYDIAVIKVDETGLQPVTLGDSELLNVGDRVLAIGNPLGELTFTMTGGMVSSVNRTIDVDGIPFNMIQTDASINPGNSGGPLFNQYGEVVGIVSAKYSSDGTDYAEGLGFAIPINDVVAMIEEIMTTGYVSNKPYLGAYIGTLTQDMARQYRYSISEGAFVYSVYEDSPAAAAGLQMGDVITKIDDKDITALQDITVAKKSYSAGDTCTLTVYRASGTVTLQLTWGETPEDTDLNEDDSNASVVPDTGNNGNDDYYYYGSDDMQDLFDYFFGRTWGR